VEGEGAEEKADDKGDGGGVAVTKKRKGKGRGVAVKGKGKGGGVEEELKGTIPEKEEEEPTGSTQQPKKRARKAEPTVQVVWAREDSARASYDKKFALAKKKRAEADLADADAMLAEAQLAEASRTVIQLEASLGTKCPERPPDVYSELRNSSQTEAQAKYKEGLKALAAQIEPAYSLLSGPEPEADRISLEGKVTAAFSKIWGLGITEARIKMGELQFKKARYRRNDKDLSCWKLNGQFVSLKA
jgi:hypothetical protein